MKKLLILALDRFTDQQIFSWPVKYLGAVVEVYGKNNLGLGPDDMIRGLVLEHQPDVVVWSGVCGGESMPRFETLRALRAGYRSVMVCWDAGHKDWHPYLTEYAKHDTFDLVCGVDGSFDWPRRKQDLPCLCPINPEWYDGAGADRQIDLGFMGSYDDRSRRAAVLDSLAGVCRVERRTGNPGAYKDYADFMLRCRATVNVANSAGDGAMHVKARCVEAAWAGCMLFESAGSPLRKWLRAGLDYYEYSQPNDIREFISATRNMLGSACGPWDKVAAEYGQRLREAMQPHHPRHFWERVMA